MNSTYTKGYLKGYEEGLSEAWDEIIRICSRGYTTRELQIFAKSKFATLYQQVDMKKAEFEKTMESLTKRDEIFVDKEEKELELSKLSKDKSLILETGASYLIRESRPERSFAFFSALQADGLNGLCIARMSPFEIKNRYKITNTNILWLSKMEGIGEQEAVALKTEPEIEYVSPVDLSKITTKIKSFLERNQNSMVLIEGLEYLIIHNDFKTILKFIQFLNEFIAVRKSILLIPIDPQTMDAKDFKLLEREVNQVI